MTEAVIEVLSNDPAVSGLAVLRGASVRPVGDVMFADVAREAANDIVDRLRGLDLHRQGSLHIEPVRTWLSQRGFEAERLAPGSSADSVVWADVTQQAYGDSEFNWTYVSFMSLATLIAGIAIILDSQILIIGAMVLGPEFGPVAALGVALVRRRLHLLLFAGRTLVTGVCGRNYGDDARDTGRSGTWLGDDRRRDRTKARNCVHLHTGQVVVHRRHHRRGGRRSVTHVCPHRRSVRRIHFGDNRSGGWKRCHGACLRCR